MESFRILGKILKEMISTSCTSRANQLTMMLMLGACAPNATKTSVIRRVPAWKVHRSAPKNRSRLVIRAGWNDDITFHKSTVVKQEIAAANLHRILIDVGATTSQGYKTAGQFVQAKVNESKPGFFAIASPPGDTNNAGVIELLVKNQGESAELLCTAQEGSQVDVSDVLGKGFQVDKIPADAYPICYLFATGSGISPVKALIESGKLDAANRKLVRLYYGVKNEDSMAYKYNVQGWKDEYGVEVVPVFSEEGKGYVQDVFIKDGCEMGAGVAAILCGQKGMVEAITETLTQAGVNKDAILLNF